MQQFRFVEAQMPIPSKENIAGHLVQAAQARAWLLGLHFHKDVDFRMAGLAEHGAVVILKAAKDKKEETKERYVRGATRVGSEAMVVFVDEMAITRLTIADYVQKHGTELRDDVWTKVRDVLCPLWPIC